ncbi:class I SAM-dependent methyltransferase [Nocardioides litoris]|uniref:class I SAM-dependent methyltransferase n=1 Tax=Nocardioides litoris TaxID=1926648 RepID=UPI001FE3276A|nr:SAM-dependent methyltransferase [Nocardioides litoris]
MSDRSLETALATVREALLDADGLVRAVASGRRRTGTPTWRRVELRYVDLKAGRHLQATAYDATQAHTANHAAGPAATEAVEALLAEPFGNWHVETATHTHQVRVTKKGDALVSSKRRAQELEVERDHDRTKQHLLAADDPLWRALGLAGADGRVKPSRAAKVRQVEEFLRLLDAAVTDALAAGHLRAPTADEPLRVVDLGCGNAYLTFAAQRYLGEVRGLPVAMTGVDVKEQSREHNSRVAVDVGLPASFTVGTIAEAVVDPAPEVVLALHACDTATDEALARAVEWRAPLVLAAPCCHHDVAAQLRRGPTPPAYAEVVRHGILRERLADTLTDALRASLVRLQGYRVDVVQFVESRHTPRNTMLRAVRTGVVPDGARAELDALVGEWGLRPRLADLLADPPA